MKIYCLMEEGLLIKSFEKFDDRCLEIEAENIDDVFFDGKEIRKKSEKEKLEEIKNKKLEELKQEVSKLLSKSDYIIIKICEAEINGIDITELKNYYKDKLDERKKIREWYLQKKEEILNKKEYKDE